MSIVYHEAKQYATLQGSQLISALSNRDYPMVSGINLFFATFILFNNLLIDLLYASLDPRIRYQ